VSAPGDYDNEEIGGMIGRGNRSTRRKLAPVLLCPPQTPNAARTRTRAAAVGSQRLTAELRHGQVVSLTRRGRSAARRIRSIEKSNDLVKNRSSDIPACGIVPQPTTLPRVTFHTMFPINSRLLGDV
jgi:hypothetical protein